MRYIYPDETNRMIQEEVIDIPMNELIRFNYGIEYTFDFTDSITAEDVDTFDAIIKKNQGH